VFVFKTYLDYCTYSTGTMTLLSESKLIFNVSSALFLLADAIVTALKTAMYHT
jgi:hypothetical protein